MGPKKLSSMAPTKKGIVLAQTDFPMYTVNMVGDVHFLVAGGGGQAKTGVSNSLEIYELRRTDGICSVVKIHSHDTDRQAIMNAVVIEEGKMYTLAAGLDGKCQIFNLRYKVVTQKEGNTDGNAGVRKRKGNLTQSQEHKSAAKVVTFEVEPLQSVQTDFHVDGGFQKVVKFVSDKTLMVTGGADGYLRVWQYPSLRKLYEVKAHTNEIDDLDIHPLGNRIVTVSKDNKAYLWSTKEAKKMNQLVWNHRVDKQYRFRACRFGIVVDKKDKYALFTTHIPVRREQKPLPCFITSWDTTRYVPANTVNTGTEILSAFAISDEGIYLGVGTISGSVEVYISFSLQKLFSVRQAHNIFVTGLEFIPSSKDSRAVMGNSEVSLISISADNQIKLHQLPNRTPYTLWWVVAGLSMIIYLIFWLISTVGL